MAAIVNRTTLFLLLAGTLALGACRDEPQAAAEPPAPTMQGHQLVYPANHPQVAQLGIATAAAAKTLTVDLPARLVWNEDRTQRIYPAFAGRVAHISADLGQPVKAGTVLAQLASPDFGIAQADTAKAQVDARLAQKSLARQRELFEAGVVARKELEQAEADAGRSQAEVQRAEARTHMYGAQGGGVDQRLALVAGIAGVVVERNLTPGQELRPDQMGPGVPPLFVVSDPSSLWVQIDARETEAGTLRPGASFELLVPSLPGGKFEGRVIAAADFIDPATRTIKVRGLIANADRRLKAEMLATARVERSPGPGVMVPASAVLLRDARQSVFVQVRPGVFEPRDITVGWQGPKEVLVSSGLEAGEQVVSDNTLLLARQYGLLQSESPRGEENAGPAAAATADTKSTAAR
jgi:cobalt-zinc-cadmium efflux system membrane fusion protein